MNYLIVDLNIQLDGHKIGFVQQTLNWLAKNQPEHKGTFHFLVNAELQIPESANIKVEVIKPHTSANFEAKTALKKYKKQWDFIKLKASQFDAQKIILMEFDIYQVAIGNDSKTGFDVSGIWFRPYFRQVSLSKSIITTTKFKIAKWRKQAMFRLALRNKNLQQIFVLNDRATVNAINEKHGERLFYLPDPVFDYNITESIDIRAKYVIEKSKIIFLIFGHIDNRKNVVNILKSLEALPKEMQSDIVLLMIGKVAPEYKLTLEEALEKSRCAYQILQNDKFVSDDEMEALFAQSDLILRMNVNYFASSGIIGMAAKYNKPSLVSDYGIVADLTKEYKLGFEVNPEDTAAITKKFAEFINSENKWKMDGQAYYKDHGTEAFVKTLLDLP
ncbi:glycosyltransferase [uncultured Arcticibacterium sp.]|uniref:glycosyltransferase n=1 Tax=uncultured Arcticibacterium sp. TaxID=2173042 RepID=UPI0030F79ED4